MAKPKVIAGIDCDSAAAEGIQRVLSSRLEEMCALRRKALEWSDEEGVHDMRVASRRLRSALSDFTPYLRRHALTSCLVQIRSIADALGEVRDQDVAIKALETLATKTPADVTTALGQIVDEHKAVRDKARKELKRILRKNQLRQLESDFAMAINAATSRPQRTKRATGAAYPTTMLTYRTVGKSIILERLKELEQLSDSFYRPLEGQPLHKMRIAAKRLRYALGLFEQCWETTSIYADRAAGLQLTLGDLHDCDVWIETFGKRLAGTDQNTPGQMDASVWLLNHFMKLRAELFSSALACWREWEKDELSAELRKALQKDARPSTRARVDATQPQVESLQVNETTSALIK